MKKTLIILLIFSIFSFGLFANDPPVNPTSTFDVKTTVIGKHELKLTTADVSALVPGTYTSLTDSGVTAFAGPVTITSAGVVPDFTAYISALSNSAAGFTVTMKATAMASEENSATNSHKIHYTVTAGTGVGAVSYATKTNNTAVEVITASGLEGTKAYSEKIAIVLDTASFNSALQDNYLGTVTFEYIAGT